MGNVTINVLPGLSTTTKDSTTVIDNLNTFGIEIHSKASLKQYHYKKGEFFWEGGGQFLISKDIQGTDLELFSIESDMGYSTNIHENFLLATDIGLNGEWLNYTPTGQEKQTNKELYVYGEIVAGFDFQKKYSILSIYRHSLFKELGKNYFKSEISLPIQYNVDRDTAINIIPSYEHNNLYNMDTYKIMIGFSWLYR